MEIYFCYVKPAGAVATFFYQVLHPQRTHGPFLHGVPICPLCQQPLLSIGLHLSVGGHEGSLSHCCLQVAVVLWLFLLFRVLGSTAENFFSPILTQLSQEMGLPPRFAGGALVLSSFAAISLSCGH